MVRRESKQRATSRDHEGHEGVPRLRRSRVDAVGSVMGRRGPSQGGEESGLLSGSGAPSRDCARCHSSQAASSPRKVLIGSLVNPVSLERSWGSGPVRPGFTQVKFTKETKASNRAVNAPRAATGSWWGAGGHVGAVLCRVGSREGAASRHSQDSGECPRLWTV